MCGIFPLCFARRVRLFPPFFLGRLYHGLCSVSLTLFCDPFRQLTRVAGRSWQESRRQEERLRKLLPPAPSQQPQATRACAPSCYFPHVHPQLAARRLPVSLDRGIITPGPEHQLPGAPCPEVLSSALDR